MALGLEQKDNNVTEMEEKKRPSELVLASKYASKITDF